MPYPDVLESHRLYIIAHADLRFARAQYREAQKPDPIRLSKLKSAMQDWERALREWGQRIEANPHPDSQRAWKDADSSRVPIPE